MRSPSAPRVKRDGWLVYAVGLPIALLVLAPFLYMVATALPRARWETFAAALAAAPFDRFFLNSAIFSEGTAIGLLSLINVAGVAPQTALFRNIRRHW